MTAEQMNASQSVWPAQSQPAELQQSTCAASPLPQMVQPNQYFRPAPLFPLYVPPAQKASTGMTAPPSKYPRYYPPASNSHPYRVYFLPPPFPQTLPNAAAHAGGVKSQTSSSLTTPIYSARPATKTPSESAATSPVRLAQSHEKLASTLLAALLFFVSVGVAAATVALAAVATAPPDVVVIVAGDAVEDLVVDEPFDDEPVADKSLEDEGSLEGEEVEEVEGDEEVEEAEEVEEDEEDDVDEEDVEDVEDVDVEVVMVEEVEEDEVVKVVDVDGDG
ncbi:hypothetical protein MBLNU459_g4416t2 [Dothideomycetes sp. NU459]